jgi:uncharacterized repeat protein (TIGR01451 family)
VSVLPGEAHDPDPATVGKLLTYIIVVTNTGDEEAQGVVLSDSVDNSSGSFDPDVFSVSTTAGSCMVQAIAAVGCQLGNLAPGAQATVTVRTVPTSAETLINEAFAEAINAPDTGTSIETEVGEDLGEDNGQRVLVNHKGKELCLPEAALNGHLKHGDEVIDEEGCSNAGAKNGKHERDGGASGK